MDALVFIEDKKALSPRPVYILAGPERFLKDQALERIQRGVFDAADVDFGISRFEGESADFAAVRDELETLPFLAPRRLVVVQDADPFVSKYREPLEKYLEKPSRTGVLVLDVKTWRSNTRLAKAIPESATIKCEAPAAYRLPQWAAKWAKQRYEKELSSPAASLLVELVGGEMGILNQDLAKLAAYVGDRPQIEPADVDALVGHSRTETAWQMLDAVADGKKAQALAVLEHLFDQGEEPIAILGAMSWQLRRLAQVGRLKQQGVGVSAAMGRAGVPPFAQQRTEQQLRHLGPRVTEIYDWLLDADLSLKSSDRLPAKAVLERLLIKLAV